jgi:hypothetical protein
MNDMSEKDKKFLFFINIEGNESGHLVFWLLGTLMVRESLVRGIIVQGEDVLPLMHPIYG